MSAVRSGELDGEPEQLMSGRVSKVTGRIRVTTRRSLMAVLRLSIGIMGCGIGLRLDR
jgi:hypothetical protein